MKKLRGKVENIEFTSGSIGNQWTTIDGIRYMTFWDAFDANWKVGDTVDFDGGMKRPYGNYPEQLMAENISKHTPPQAKPE